MDVDVGTHQHRTDIGHDGVARQVEAVELHRHAAGVLAGTGRRGRSGDAQSVLAKCTEMPDALPPRCLRDLLWAYDERIPAATDCSLSRAGKAPTDVGADGLLWPTALWSQYECRHLAANLKFHHRPPEFSHYIKHLAYFLGLGF